MQPKPARRSTPTILIVTMALSSAVAGCGGSYTKHDFIARADAICASALQQARSIPPPSFAGPASQADSALTAYIAKLLPVVQTEVGQLQRLPRPVGDGRALLERWVGALGHDLGSYRTLAAAARHGDATGVTDAEAVLQASPADSLAASYGMNACASQGGTVGSGV